ncbi:MAG: hypothetical protein ABIG37_02020 [Nanoarchaeota archaeon]|nr:hypothetical protein [Nanoarchaeota archaeon]
MTFKIKDIILGLIIAVIFVMFLAYGTKLVYEEPDYSNYCDEKIRPQPIEKVITQEECESEGGTWNNDWCDYYAECNKEYEKVNENYRRNMFLISLIIGVIVIVISALFIEIGSIYGGLMLGSLFFIVYGTGGYWQYMNDWLRFIILGVALCILIYLGYRISKK